MALQYKFFSIRVPYGIDEEDTLNAFLRTVRIVHMHHEIVCQDGRHYWAVAIEYLSGGGNFPQNRTKQKEN